MTETERLAAIEAIRQAKARYWRGVDLGDGDLVRSVLAEDCELDYHGCCTDPQSGVDHLPAMNLTLRGRDAWVPDGMARFGIVSVHQGHQSEIEVTGPDSARGIWSFTDRMFFPAGGAFSRLTGYGFYHEDYVRVDGVWLIKATRITRIRVEVE
ncbi:SnoaL-like protein [Novosphingobium sp. PhB165]|uniref:nuclear transport factor 2 family protein n=1 Tax=Novosphingobium sp. PhB165 TaxID=2485105 RepID=UPI00104D72DA|nr:nuclear transport factor 2 family protein [Novosphingobium sp. PhB165]TCM17026.1 SnoaL-like protein [Novosphingobium sp. PhB165]